MVIDPVAVVAACVSVVTFLLGLLVHDFLVLSKEQGQWIGRNSRKVGNVIRNYPKQAGDLRLTVESVIRDGRRLVTETRLVGCVGVAHLLLSMIWFTAYLNEINWEGLGANLFPWLTVVFIFLWLRWLFRRTKELAQDFDKLKREL